MKPVDVRDNTYIDSTELHSIKRVNDKTPKLKVGDQVSFENTKTFLLNDTLQIGLKKFL